jgi:hypothetical protein
MVIPSPIKEESHDELTVDDRLDKIVRSAIQYAAAQLAVLILVASVVYAPVVHVCKRRCCGEKHAGEEPAGLHDISRDLESVWMIGCLRGGGNKSGLTNA